MGVRTQEEEWAKKAVAATSGWASFKAPPPRIRLGGAKKSMLLLSGTKC